MSPAKHIAVIVATDVPARAREALRAAVGLSLRGDAVRVVLAAAPDDAAADPDIARALRVLGELGLSVSRSAAAAAAREADAVEVWT